MVVVVGLPYVMSFMSTRRSAKPVKERLGSTREELQKSFPTANNLPEKTPDHLKPENAAQKRHSEENVHDELQRSVKTPSNLQRKVAFCPPRRHRAPLLRCNMSDLKSVYTQIKSLGYYTQMKDLEISKSSILKKKKESEEQRFWTRVNLNRRPLAQETLVYPSELSTTRRPEAGKEY